MPNKPHTHIQVPHDVNNPVELQRFLQALILYIDRLHGLRGGDAVATSSNVLGEVNSLKSLIDGINNLAGNYSLADGTRNFTGVVSYDNAKTFTTSNQLVSKSYVDNIVSPQTAPTDLAQTISDPPTQVEVQNISDKIDELLASLKLTKILN